MENLDLTPGIISQDNSPADSDTSRFALSARRGSHASVARTFARPEAARRADAQGAPAMPKAVEDNWNRFVNAPISGRVFRTIVRYAMRNDGWRGPGSRALSGQAVRSFLDFYHSAAPAMAEPDIALTASGGLQAHWIKSKQNILDLTFDADGNIYFGLFKGKRILEGVDTLEGVLNILRNDTSRPLTWKR